mgnify:CR=1 FL=1
MSQETYFQLKFSNIQMFQELSTLLAEVMLFIITKMALEEILIFREITVDLP